MGRRLLGWFLLGLGAAACPCHLPLTLGLLGALTGWALVGKYAGMAYGVGAFLFFAGLTSGVYLLRGITARHRGKGER